MARIVAFGASTIHGCNDQINSGFIHMLGRYFEADSPTNLLYELGVWGDTLERMLTRVSEVEYRRPSKTIVYTGLNDIRRIGKDRALATDLPAVEALTEELLMRLMPYNPILLTALPINEQLTTPFRNSDSYYFNEDVKELNGVQRSLCERNGIAFVDCYYDWSSKISTYLSADGLHPSTDGHNDLFTRFLPTIKLKNTCA